MRTNEMLPDYIIDADGSVFYKENGEKVELEKGQYRLHTSEKLYCSIKKKTIKLVRRLSPKDIIALYQRSNGKMPEQIKENKTKIKEKVNPINKGKSAGLGVLIDGHEYVSASEASKALGVAVNTIINRCKSENKFNNYSFI